MLVEFGSVMPRVMSPSDLQSLNPLAKKSGYDGHLLRYFWMKATALEVVSGFLWGFMGFYFFYLVSCETRSVGLCSLPLFAPNNLHTEGSFLPTLDDGEKFLPRF